jgi:hypothetical protein
MRRADWVKNTKKIGNRWHVRVHKHWRHARWKEEPEIFVLVKAYWRKWPRRRKAVK